jgi:uncharacterized protein YjdB
MALRKCPNCGEMYSSSYRECPFCEEEAAYEKPELRKKRGRRVEHQKAPSIFGPVLALVILLVVCAAGVYFFGDDIKGLFTKNETPAVETQQVTLSDTTLALTVGDTADLAVTGGSGDRTWQSSDGGVASISESGTITAVAPGTATVTVTVGKETATCTVTVTEKNAQTQPETPATPDTPSTPDTPAANLSLQSIYGTKDDISLGVGDTAPMEVTGTDSAVTWSIADSSVATVSGNGTVTGVASGKTTLTATVNGQNLTCVIRVG